MQCELEIFGTDSEYQNTGSINIFIYLSNLPILHIVSILDNFILKILIITHSI